MLIEIGDGIIGFFIGVIVGVVLLLLLLIYGWCNGLCRMDKRKWKWILGYFSLQDNENACN